MVKSKQRRVCTSSFVILHRSYAFSIVDPVVKSYFSHIVFVHVAFGIIVDDVQVLEVSTHECSHLTVNCKLPSRGGMQTADRQSIFIYIFRPTPPSQIQDDTQIDQFLFPDSASLRLWHPCSHPLAPEIYLFAVYLVLPSFSALRHGPPLRPSPFSSSPQSLSLTKPFLPSARGPAYLSSSSTFDHPKWSLACCSFVPILNK